MLAEKNIIVKLGESQPRLLKLSFQVFYPSLENTINVGLIHKNVVIFFLGAFFTVVAKTHSWTFGSFLID